MGYTWNMMLGPFVLVAALLAFGGTAAAAESCLQLHWGEGSTHEYAYEVVVDHQEYGNSGGPGSHRYGLQCSVNVSMLQIMTPPAASDAADSSTHTEWLLSLVVNGCGGVRSRLDASGVRISVPYADNPELDTKYAQPFLFTQSASGSVSSVFYPVDELNEVVHFKQVSGALGVYTMFVLPTLRDLC